MTLGVLFDIDGTLVTFKFDVEGSRKALFEELARQGFGVTGLSPTSPTQYVVDAARRQIAAGLVSADFGMVRRKLYSILDGFELESGKSVYPFPGVKEALAALQRRSARLAVLTNSGRRAATRILERGSLTGYFDFVLTRDDVDAMKPSPDGVSLAVSRFSLPKERVVYVGDSLYDIMAAKSAGLKVVSVATGNYTVEKLRGEGADVVIQSLSELADVLPL